MHIRHFQPGDADAQARIYNAAAGTLPAFKPANSAEIVRRYQHTDPATKFYAVDGNETVGYAVFDVHGRISYPWCLPHALHAREPLLAALLSAMTERRITEAWAAYRADWTPVITFFREHQFQLAREMINFVAEVARLPRVEAPANQTVTRLRREELPHLVRLAEGLLSGGPPEHLERFFWESPWFAEDSLLALRRPKDGAILGAAVVIIDPGYADPTKLDAAMPCFRLGAIGTERERHKRVNGMFSCVSANELAGIVLLSEAVRRLEASGVTHVAAQVRSDRPDLVAFYDRYFLRQGTFPVLARPLSPDSR